MADDGRLRVYPRPGQRFFDEAVREIVLGTGDLSWFEERCV